ncbi:hypothetical protein QE375_003662 [Microbacterium foliorum]|uniref:Relaxase/mobilization nuclease domain-containing protein n=1 Tax=Microbacterium foliorum TaxID=104336 RepID=A0ABU1HVM3_9MICO|nr:hypothetical protein [Microbacterium foliorum]MDR6144108.1 hypothetical protein [Microbacterium foliorum]
MPIEYVGKTTVASRLLRYTVTPKSGQTIKDRVLHVAGQHCRPETAEREFAATRRRHGTQGAMRTSPSKYRLPESGELATHLRRHRPNGRGYWDEAKSGETATHVRHPGIRTRQSEAAHWITSFGANEVNPNDTEQVSRAFRYVVTRHQNLYPGEQATFVGQADGAGNMFHVHITRNATLYADMIVDGRKYSAGRKLAGALTNVDAMRERADRFLAEHGDEYELGPQLLPSVTDSKREKRNQRDRRMAARGERSNHDVIRDAFEAALEDPRAVGLDSWMDAMAVRGVVVRARPRRGSDKNAKSLSYQLPGMPVPVRGSRLGSHYDFINVVLSLDAKAMGRRRLQRPERFSSPPPRPVSEPTPGELAIARRRMEELAAAESALRKQETALDLWITERARSEKVAFGDILERLPRSYAGQVRAMTLWHHLASGVDAERESLDSSPAISSAPTTKSSEADAETPPVSRTMSAKDAALLNKLILNAPTTRSGRPTLDMAKMFDFGMNAATLVAIRAVWDRMTEVEQRNFYEAEYSPSTQAPPMTAAASPPAPPTPSNQSARVGPASPEFPTALDSAIDADFTESPAPVSAGAARFESEPTVDKVDERQAVAELDDTLSGAGSSEPADRASTNTTHLDGVRRDVKKRPARRFFDWDDGNDDSAPGADRGFEY